MLGKDVFIDTNSIKFYFKFVCEWGLFNGDFGTSRVRNGMPGSLPSSLLTPTVPCCNIMRIHMEWHVTVIKLKSINDWNLVNVMDDIVWN